MKIKVTHHADQEYLEAVIDGPLDMEAFNRAHLEMDTMMDRHQCRTVLYDMRHIEVLLETHEIYAIPRQLREDGHTDIRRALVFPAVHEQDFTFFETVSGNQGLNTRVFADKNEALDWLLA
ncbi:hypothetical protein [Pontiella sp.]|uniref:hypothetical protein n=1 Tax=Pontiella sp. TaxID=2837462 RepID=UPI00356471CF